MFTCALIGADGSGKSTVCERLPAALPMPMKCLYMGVNSERSQYVLPTTRLIRAAKRAFGAAPDTAGPRDPAELATPRPRGLVKRGLRSLRAGLRLANRLLEESYGQLVAWFFLRAGNVVLFDRHYLADYYAYDVAPTTAPRPLSRRIHGFFLMHILPKPDLVIFLDAEPEVLFARKGEGTLELLAQRRADYLQLRDVVPAFEVVDASQPLERVVEQVADRLIAAHAARLAGARGVPC
jgi:thymidylate kinase